MSAQDRDAFEALLEDWLGEQCSLLRQQLEQRDRDDDAGFTDPGSLYDRVAQIPEMGRVEKLK